MSANPLFSICIPQHNRTSFLLRVLESVKEQTFKDFEVCISDDCSDDGREQEIAEYLASSGMKYKLSRQVANLRYDGNLREAISLATGRYILLMGNDDCLKSPTTLLELSKLLYEHPSAGVVVTNFEDFATGAINVRVNKLRVSAGSSLTAALNFRNLAFVSGILLERITAQENATSKWDGSEMYQVFLAGRILTRGFSLIHFPLVTVRKDVQIPGELVANYARRPVLEPCPIIERTTNLLLLGQVACDGCRHDLQKRVADHLTFLIFAQLLTFTYPFWIFEYRRVQSWRFAVGLCLGMRLRRQLGPLKTSFTTHAALEVLYLIATLAGLCAPLSVFDRLRPILYKLAKSTFYWRSSPAMRAGANV